MDDPFKLDRPSANNGTLGQCEFGKYRQVNSVLPAPGQPDAPLHFRRGYFFALVGIARRSRRDRCRSDQDCHYKVQNHGARASQYRARLKVLKPGALIGVVLSRPQTLYGPPGCSACRSSSSLRNPAGAPRRQGFSYRLAATEHPAQ